jgi:hypothetical protein
MAGHLPQYGRIRSSVFHLIDQGHVKSVDPESIEAAKRVLSKQIISATVSSSEWAQKDNAARLEWLREQSAITVNIKESGIGLLVIDESNPPG